MFKKTLIASALLAGSSAALAEISGNVSLLSDYAFRGVSQTDEQIALQGGFDWSHDSGFYVGTWASNVDSSFFNDPQDPQLEIDLYAGFGGELGNGISYDFGILHYDYPGADAADTDELYISGSMSGFTVSLNYSDELAFVGSKESAYYLAAGYEMSLPQDFGLSVHIGLSDGDAFDPGKPTGLPDSIVDWSIGISKSVAGVDLGLTYVDSDADDATFFDDLADSRIVFSISKSL
ncbi:MAG: TorF family putative porin [Gammaproteobacteria bacterium]|nr:TorF family putative porin [Gammaproteobacteria bacterium]MDH3560744.1 TorF family putative porin [Gammaproteobacteria bacterium]